MSPRQWIQVRSIEAYRRSLPVALVAILLGGGAGAAWCAEAMASWEPVDYLSLAHANGGFRGDDGVTVAFAIDVQMRINGAPVTDRALTIGTFAPLPGAGSSIRATLTPGEAKDAFSDFALVLKNSANRQLLQVRTAINVDVNGLAAVRALQSQRLMSSWQGAGGRP